MISINNVTKTVGTDPERNKERTRFNMLTEKKHIQLLSALCFMVYFTSYVTRINFGAIVSEIVSAEGFLKTSVSFVITAGFFSYGIGQLISGIIGDKMNPQKIIFWGLLCTSAFNFIIPFCKSIMLMAVIWTLNGFAQSTIWSPLVKVMSNYFSKNEFNKSCVTVSIGSSVGTIAVYLFAPAIIHFSNWETVLVCSGTIAFIVAFVWINCMKKIEHFSTNNLQGLQENMLIENGQTNINANKLIASSGLIFIIIGVVSQGIVKDGVTTWMPSYISETFHIKNALSILSAVVLPVFSIVSVKITAYLQKNVYKNELTCATVIFSVALFSVILMAIFYTHSIWLSIALFSIITGCMHGINLILISLVPIQFSKFGNVSSITGMLNFFAYIGSALSMYGIAKLSELYGWQFTVYAWALITFIGALACFVCINQWAHFTSNTNRSLTNTK